MAIRYDQKLNREIAKTVRNFNAKVRRLEKLQRELVPSRVTVASIKEETTSRADLERKLKELRGFSARGAEDIITTEGGVRTTRYEFQLTKERARIAKLRVKREMTELGKIAPTVYGRKQAHKFSEMGSEEMSNLEARRKMLDKDINRLNANQYENYKKRVDGEYQEYYSRRAGVWRESLKDILRKAGYAADVPKDRVEYIIKQLDTLSMRSFLLVTSAEQAFKEILDYYIQMKLNAGVLSSDDESKLQDAFDGLYENIDDIIENYSQYSYFR